MAPRGERHTKRHTSVARGRSARDKQLGRVQRLVLRWLLASEYRIQKTGSQSERRTLDRYGVPWRKVHEAIGERPSAVSEALRPPAGRGLEARGLVEVVRTNGGGRATHVRLTRSGRRAAILNPGCGTWEELRQDNLRWMEEHFGPRDHWSAAESALLIYLMEFLEDRAHEASEALGAPKQVAGTVPDEDLVRRFVVNKPE